MTDDSSKHLKAAVWDIRWREWRPYILALPVVTFFLGGLLVYVLFPRTIIETRTITLPTTQPPNGTVTGVPNSAGNVSPNTGAGVLPNTGSGCRNPNMTYNAQAGGCIPIQPLANGACPTGYARDPDPTSHTPCIIRYQ